MVWKVENMISGGRLKSKKDEVANVHRVGVGKPERVIEMDLSCRRHRVSIAELAPPFSW